MNEIQERAKALMAQELTEPEGQVWMSFCDLDKPKGQQFNGVAIVRARGPALALTRACLLGINPGGEVVFVAVHGVAPALLDRLLSMDDLHAAGLL